MDKLDKGPQESIKEIVVEAILEVEWLDEVFLVDYTSFTNREEIPDEIRVHWDNITKRYQFINADREPTTISENP